MHSNKHCWQFTQWSHIGHSSQFVHSSTQSFCLEQCIAQQNQCLLCPMVAALSLSTGSPHSVHSRAQVVHSSQVYSLSSYGLSYWAFTSFERSMPQVRHLNQVRSKFSIILPSIGYVVVMVSGFCVCAGEDLLYKRILSVYISKDLIKPLSH